MVGPGHARVQLTAEFDFNRITQTSDKFDPESRVVRSSQTREEVIGAAATPTPAASRSATNCRAPTQARGGQQQPRDQNRKTEEIVNYEISRTTKTEVIEGGRVNRISVAVVVDGIYAKNDKGEIAYQPRGKEEIDRIAALVRSAIGFDAKRGDQVEVANLRLAETPSFPISEPTGWMSMLQFTKDDIMHWVEVGVMSLLAPPRAAARRPADGPPHPHAGRRGAARRCRRAGRALVAGRAASPWRSGRTARR